MPPVVATEIAAEAISLTIVHEDQWLVVVDKPAGLVVHPCPRARGGDASVNALLAHCQDLRGIGGVLRPGIVHRLDKETSGLLVVAKDDATMNALGAAFKAHTIERVYEALVAGAPPGTSGRIDSRSTGAIHASGRSSPVGVRSGKRAITNWRLHRRSFRGQLRMEARYLETGRGRTSGAARAPGGRSAVRCWATRSTAGPRAISRSVPSPTRSGGRPCMRDFSASFTPRPASR